MLKYLIDFGVDNIEEEDIIVESDIDINDRAMLQSQINSSRSSYVKAIKLLDNLRGEYIKAKYELSEIIRKFTIQYENKVTRANFLNQDVDYQNIKIKIEALSEAIKTVELQVDFIKSDQRVLNGSMYNRQ